MRILFDTSVLVASFVSTHPKYHVAIKWLQRVIKKEISMVVSGHSLAECFSTLTKLPLSPKISPDMAAYLLRENVERHAKIVVLSAKDYQVTVKKMSELGLSGGIIYDAIIMKAAEKAKVEKVLTLNAKDFLRLPPHDSSWIITP